MFSMNSRIRKEKKMKLPSPEPYFYFIFFHYWVHRQRGQQRLSLTLSLNDHYKKKKKSYGHIYHTLGHCCRKTAIFILLLLCTFFFIPRTPATIAAIIQMPLLHFCSQCAFVPAHYSLSDTILPKQYLHTILY